MALSRAIGDRSERPAVASDPEFSIVELTEEDDFLILGTDGLFDVMSSEDVVAFLHAVAAEAHGEVDYDEMATLLVAEALRRGADDNITVIIVWFRTFTDSEESAA